MSLGTSPSDGAVVDAFVIWILALNSNGIIFYTVNDFTLVWLAWATIYLIFVIRSLIDFNLFNAILQNQSIGFILF